MYLKFDIVREYISKHYPEIMDDYDSECDDDGDDDDDVIADTMTSSSVRRFEEFRTEEVNDIEDDHEGDIDSSDSSSSD